MIKSGTKYEKYFNKREIEGVCIPRMMVMA
jgi:hypothetical protein